MQGLTYDHVELKLYINGRPTDARFFGIRGTVFPVVYGKDLVNFCVFPHRDIF